LASSTQRHVSTQVPLQRKRQGHEQATKNDVKSKPVGIESQGKLAMKTLIIGLGNPILGEDGVGWKVAKQLNNIIDPDSSVDIDCASCGGLSLMERMLGYQRVIVIDSMETGRSPEGCVKVFPLIALENPYAGHSASADDASLMTALQAAESIGAEVPARVDVVTIETKNAYGFPDNLSPEIEKAVPLAAKEVLKLLED
jgi:hydrogenase maturation protease